MDTSQSFKLFLASITKMIEHQQEVASITGENYNLFKVIHMTSNETSVHSAFIADLLNPKGLHGMGNQFLSLFIKEIDTYINKFEFNTDNAQVEIERYIGERTKENGGRLDIIITNQNNQAIIIENKIYAEDQEAQMLRYYNYAKQKYPNNHLLLYLSLDGVVHNTEFTTQNKISQDKDFYTISYIEHILNWLNQCKQLAVDKPLLREGITHYINLIKILTHTNMNKQTREEMINFILENPDYLKNLNNYATTIEGAKKCLIVNFWNNLYIKMKDMYKENELYLVKIEDDQHKKVSIINNPSEDDIKEAASKFQLKNQNRRKPYIFGIAQLVSSKEGQTLLSGIMIDRSITFRVFTIEQGRPISYTKTNDIFKHIRGQITEPLFPNDAWDKEFYICARSPQNSELLWNLAGMNDDVLENLSNMDTSVNKLLAEFNDFNDFSKTLS